MPKKTKKKSPQLRDRPVLIYNLPDFGSEIISGAAIFHKQGCPIRNCILSTTESHKNTADVIVFGANSVWEPPIYRRPDQLWIIRLLESPENTNSLAAYDNLVNITASYRENSDLPIAYGRYEKFRTPLKITGISYAKDKKKMVAWFVSHCLTNNNRMAYAYELSKYIQVDIFGTCGMKNLGKKEGHRMIRDHYKFYLAFENSNCRQYITEKFWMNGLRNNAIPIVMGAPKIDYIKVAPPHSFIHVDDYNPRQLARFLSYLDQNATAYNEYFEWKNFGRVVDSDFYCRLCDMVQSPPTKTYVNLDSWWRGNGDCQKYSNK